jgi:hypothetical protein
MQTEKDAEIVGWLGRIGAASAEHVMTRFGMGRSWAYARLSRLVRDGLLEHKQLLFRRPGLYVATAEGLRWTFNERLGAYRLGPGGFQHAWELATTAVARTNRSDTSRRSRRRVVTVTAKTRSDAPDETPGVSVSPSGRPIFPLQIAAPESFICGARDSRRRFPWLRTKASEARSRPAELLEILPRAFCCGDVLPRLRSTGRTNDDRCSLRPDVARPAVSLALRAGRCRRGDRASHDAARHARNCARRADGIAWRQQSGMAH